MKVKSISRVRLLATPWTAASQAPPSMGFSRQEYWGGVPLPSPERLSRAFKAFFLFSFLIPGIQTKGNIRLGQVGFGEHFDVLVLFHFNRFRKIYMSVTARTDSQRLLEEVGYEVGDLWSVRSAIEKNNSGFSLLSDLNLLMKFLGSFLS